MLICKLVSENFSERNLEGQNGAKKCVAMNWAGRKKPQNVQQIWKVEIKHSENG